MLYLIIFLVIVISLGLFIGNFSHALKINRRILTGIFYILLFVTGIATNSDDRIVTILEESGWISFLILIAAFFCTITLIWLFPKLISRIRMKISFTE